MFLSFETYLTVLHTELLHVGLQVRINKIEKLVIVAKSGICLRKAEEEKDGHVGIDGGQNTLFTAHWKEVFYDEAVELVWADFGVNHGACHTHQLNLW